MLDYSVMFMLPEYMRKQAIETIVVHQTAVDLKTAIHLAREEAALELMLPDPAQLALITVFNGLVHAYTCPCDLCRSMGYRPQI